MLTPDEIAARQFLVSLRGYDRQEVQAFLRDVADQQAELQRRAQDLERELDAARAGASTSAPPAAGKESAGVSDTRAAFAALGEETTRVLVAAEESAQAIRQRAEDRAADEVARAQREAREQVESARRTASKILAEAERRRDAVAEEIRKLEDAREAFLGALHGAVEGVQASVGSLRPAAAPEVDASVEPEAQPAPEPEAQPEPEPEAAPQPPAEVDAAPEEEVDAEPGPVVDAEPESDADLREVGRSVGADAVTETDEEELVPGAAVVDPDRTTAEARSEDAHTADAMTSAVAQAAITDELDAAEEIGTTGTPPPPEAEPAAVADAPLEDTEPATEAAAEPVSAPEQTPDPIALRDESLAGVRPGMVRRLKRGLQDVQNGVLDAIRRAGDAPTLDAVLPRDEELATLGQVGQLFLTAAYRAGLVDGAALVGAEPDADRGDESQIPASAATFRAVLSHEITASLTATLRAGIEAGEPETSLSERVGEVFRDLKGPVVEGVVDEHLARIYGYGLENAWSRLEVEAKDWVVGAEPRCPANQCRVNAEEGPVPLAEEFPSGERVPPAHDGCTCALKPV